MEKKLIRTHRDLEIYQKAFDLSMKIFVKSKSFPKDGRFSLTDQIRRSSRSVCTNMAEAWRKRRYEASFVNKLNDVEECFKYLCIEKSKFERKIDELLIY